jgi:hypothetical protein
MAWLKDNIQDEVQLIERAKSALQAEKEQIIAVTSHNRELVQNAKRNTFVAMFCFCVVCVFFTFLENWFLIAIALLVLVSLALWGHYVLLQYIKAQKDLASKLNSLLVGVFTKTLGFEVKTSPHSLDAKEVFTASGLSVDSYDNFFSDDTYSFATQYPTVVREIKSTKQQNTGKSSRTITVFQGTFIEVTLTKKLEGQTYISTEGDKLGMAHQSFWGSVLGGNAVTETTLEWNEFERDLHVATNNGSEARYILTPNFMLDLHTWWSQKKENIRLVFKENKLFMLLPDRQVKIGSSITEVDDEALLEYVVSVVRPLWRVGLLLEDLKL